MKQTKIVLLVMLLAMVCLTAEAIQRKKFNFNRTNENRAACDAVGNGLPDG